MLCIGILLCWHAYDVMFMGCNAHLGTPKNHAVLLVETTPFPERVVIFPDYALRTSIDTFSICFEGNDLL